MWLSQGTADSSRARSLRSGVLLPLLCLSLGLSSQTACPREEVIEGFPNEFWGIGIELKVVEDRIQVIQTIPGGPAHHVGIQVGDVLLAVNQAPVKASEFGNVIAALRGHSKTQLNLTLRRGGQEIRIVVQRAFTRKTPNGYIFE